MGQLGKTGNKGEFFIIIGFKRNIKRGQVKWSSLLRSKNLELRTLRTFYQLVQ